VTFIVGEAVRYKPGFGTYGYEDVLDEADGRIAAVVIGFTPRRADTGIPRVRIRFTKPGRIVNTTRAVDAKSLVRS
jgi:hypothetical protein